MVFDDSGRVGILIQFFNALSHLSVRIYKLPAFSAKQIDVNAETSQVKKKLNQNFTNEGLVSHRPR